MPRRTTEANKAILLAWEREYRLVLGGRGTRDWTEAQQRDILENGKAYDEQNRAFEGHHMKSVEKYPRYQGDPDNIQFLSKEEHLDAHSGSWQNPTNGYYDPVTKRYLDFGRGKPAPCPVIRLNKPIAPAATGLGKTWSLASGPDAHGASFSTAVSGSYDRGSLQAMTGNHSIEQIRQALGKLSSKITQLTHELAACATVMQQEQQMIGSKEAEKYQLLLELKELMDEYERLQAEDDGSDSDDSDSAQQAQSRRMALRQAIISKRNKLRDLDNKLEAHRKRLEQYRLYVARLRKQEEDLWRLIELVQRETEAKRREHSNAESVFSNVASQRFKGSSVVQAAAEDRKLNELAELCTKCVELKRALMSAEQSIKACLQDNKRFAEQSEPGRMS